MRAAAVSGVVVGFDVGTKRLGVAVGQTVTRSATALCTIALGRKYEPWQSLSAILNTWHPAACVVGWPYPRDGEDNPIIVEIERFSAALARRYRLPVFAVDETLSTAEARQRHFAGTRRRSTPFLAQKDELAAEVILQMWLEQPTGRAIAEPGP